MIAVVPASPAHVGSLAARLRDIDRVECAVFDRTPKEALRLSLAASSIAWTAKVDGRVEAMFGAAAVSTLEGIGSPWLLMTDAAVAQGRALVELGREYTALIHRYFPRLENRVHSANAVAIRWLARLGYDIGAEALVNGHPMRGFSRCAIQ